MNRFDLKVGIRMLVSLVAGAVVLAGPTHAQVNQSQSKAPTGLKWQWMNEATFDTAWPGPESATKAEKDWAATIWSKERGAARRDLDGSVADASFVLIKQIDFRGESFIFSIYSRAGYECELAPGGSAGADQMYARCPMRVTKLAQGKQILSQDFDSYCHLNLDDKDHPRSRYHTEIGLDGAIGQVYFRVIQHGKPVPECQRSIVIAG